MTLKRILFTIFAIAITGFCNAQTPVEINYSDTSTLFLNKLQLNDSMDIQHITNIIGEPGKIVDYPNAEKSYVYENSGFVIFTKNKKVKGIGINYNWDGDKKFPEKSFTGNAKVGELSISKTTTKEDLLSIKSTPFACPMDIFCASKKRNAKIQCSVGFKDKALTQIVFMLK
jgi:hypothetical protein